MPLAIYGQNLRPGVTLRVGARDLPLSVVDAGHAFAHLAFDDPPPGRTESRHALRLVDDTGRPLPGEVDLAVVHDRAFPDPSAMAFAGGRAFVVSLTTDALIEFDSATRGVRTFAALDGPRALAATRDAAGRDRIVVAHEFSPELLVIDTAAPEQRRTIPATANACGIAIASGIAYVAEHARDTVTAIDLESGRTRWRADVFPNPRALAVTPHGLAVGSLQAGTVELLALADGRRLATISPAPGVAIVGGRSEYFRDDVIGGSAPRALVHSPRLDRLFLASIGPNVGPNARRMEVSMNGGVAVLDPAASAYRRHRGLGAGVAEGLALDDRRGLLYVADGALGRVVVIAADRLAQDDEGARGAVLQEIPIPPPDAWPTARPASDYGVDGRAGREAHSGTWALALDDTGETLLALNRLTGTIARLDVRGADRGAATLVDQTPLVPMLGQRERRIGQALYYADLGRTGITCDACHPDGQTGGILFTKTRPMRLYRSTSILGARETPPYFTPASQHSLEETAGFVGGRNRGHNPALTAGEIRALAAYTDLLVTPPSPFSGADGAPPTRLALPDGGHGDARAGLALFYGKAGCATCHPAPVFTTDQDAATRGRYDDVGTPLFFPLRERQQDLGAGVFAPPSLLGVWDVFPLYNTGTAGFASRQGGTLGVATRFPLRQVVDRPHGRVPALAPADRNDLLAYLLTL